MIDDKTVSRVRSRLCPDCFHEECNDIEDVIRELELATSVIVAAKEANAAPHANTKQSNSRMSAVEGALTRFTVRGF